MSVRALLLVLLTGAGSLGCETVRVRAELEESTTEAQDPTGAAAEETTGQRVVALSVGPRSTCAALADGSLWCWGDATDNLLGGDPGPGPVRVLQAEGLSKLSVGRRNVCFIATGGPRCFGREFEPRDPEVARQVSGAAEAVDLSAADQNICFVLPDGGVRCTGSPDVGGGVGYGRSARTVPTTAATRVGSGQHHSCAIAEGRVGCWGSGGRLGVANINNYTDTPQIVEGLDGARQLATHPVGAQTCALLAGDEIACWGMVDFGGDETLRIRRAGSLTSTVGVLPVRIPPAGEPIARIAVGPHEVLAIAESGALYRYAPPTQEGVEQPPPNPRWYTPPTSVYRAPTRLALEGVVDAGVGLTHHCALTREGAVYCWGLGIGGRLGDGSGENQAEPVRVYLPPRDRGQEP